MKTKLEIKAKCNGIAEMFMYGDIGKYDISAKLVGQELRKLDAKTNTLEIRLLSGGGDVFEGIGIYNLLKQSDKKVVMYVDGLAASIASIIMLAGDEVVMGEGSQVMIHSPWSVAAGNSKDFMDMIDRLDRVENEMVKIYQKATGMSESQILKMLSDETWFNSDEAMEYNFADRTIEAQAHMNIAASINDKEWIKKKHLIKADNEFKNKINDHINKLNDFLARN